MRASILLTSGNSPDSTAKGCAYRFRISKSKSIGRISKIDTHLDRQVILTHPVQASGARWDIRRYPSGLRLVVLRKYVGKRLVWIKLFKRVNIMSASQKKKNNVKLVLNSLTSFWTRSLIRLRSRLGSCITSPFNRRSAASPDIGLLPVPLEGLSLALTQGARPWSGISRVTLPYIAEISWLCRCSLSPLGDVMIGSIHSENSI